MKEKFCIAIIAIGVLFSPLLAATKNSSDEEGRKLVPSDMVITEDFGVAGETVEIAGTIQGDAYVAGAQVFVNGVIEGDLIVVGGTITITGKVTQNVRAMGGQVVIAGEVGRNVTAAGMNVTFADSAKVLGGIVVAAANVHLAAPVQKEARIAGRTLTLDNAIEGDLEAAVDTIRFTSNAKVGGDFTYWSNREPLIAQGATIEGNTIKESPAELAAPITEVLSPIQPFIKPFLGLTSFVTTLILGWIFLHFFPGFTKGTVATLKTRKIKSLTTGVTVLLLLPLLVGLLILTIVGIPLGLVLLLVSSLVLYVARIFAMILFGNIILQYFDGKENGMLAFLIGLVLYSVFSFFPIVGWAISLGAVVFGLGAMVQTLRDQRAKKPA
ncbi:MAG TPA: hypothetical protein VFE94_01690 [Candidatus Paceibacterota bacterium]|nr:hypothetical protein [Candidatus Paceibacterota bacterium]